MKAPDVILNPNNGSTLFTMQDLHDYANSIPDSSLVKYRTALITQLQLYKTPEDKIANEVRQLTEEMKFAECVYCSIATNFQLTASFGLLIKSNERPGKSIWDATIAMKLDATFGCVETFTMLTFPVITLRVDGAKNSPVVLADPQHSDRIAKIIGRSSVGRPWMRRVF